KGRKSPHVAGFFGGGGSGDFPKIPASFPADVNNAIALARLADSINADLTVVGPEAPLVAGVAEAFQTQGRRIVAPSSSAARLEGSKIFTKEFTKRHSIPTARYVACDSPAEAQEAMRRQFQFPVVIKADGLAAGKGVRIAT